MIAARYDFVAVGPHGVYAVTEDVPGSPEVTRFIAHAQRRGYRVERVPVAEAVERHKAFLALGGLGPADALPEG